MPLDITFDKTLSTYFGTTFDGTPATDFYAEEFVLGPSSSTKFQRFTSGASEDDKFFDMDLADLASDGEGYSVKFSGKGVEVTKTLFDGLKTAQAYGVDFDYNSEDGYLFNSIVDSRTYREVDTNQERESWIGMSFSEILEDLFVAHNNRENAGNEAALAAASNIEFIKAEFVAAVGASRADSYAGTFSFRNTSVPAVIDQIVKREGNTLWWVEKNGTKWKLKFAKRDLSGTDPHNAKMHPSHGTRANYNVINLDIKGPAEAILDAARVVDEGGGWKFQVGGPGWLNGATGGKFGTEPPVDFQLEFDSGSATNLHRSIKDAIQQASTDALLHPSPDMFKAYGYCNIEATIEDARGQRPPFSDDVKRIGYHFLPSATNSSIGLSVEIRTPIAPQKSQIPFLRLTKWKSAKDFPDKPKQRGVGTEVSDPWRIARNLLTHPNIPFAIELQSSGGPVALPEPPIRIKEAGRGEADKLKIKLQARADRLKAGTELYRDRPVATAFVEEKVFNNGDDIVIALILFFKPVVAPLPPDVYKVDTHSSHLIFSTQAFVEAGDWSAVGRNTTATSIPAGILEWVTDEDKFKAVKNGVPYPKLFVGIEDAFDTFETSTSGEWGHKFIIHGVFTVRVPQAESPATGGTAFRTEQGDYEVHNLKFNAAELDGFPIPPATERDDTERMLERAQILHQITQPRENIKGKFTIFPGDSSLKLGQFTNGGVIVKIRNDCQPYFKTTFWLESSADVDELVNPQPRETLGEIKTRVEVLSEKMRGLIKEVNNATTALGTEDKTVSKSAGEYGEDLQAVTASIRLHSKTRDNKDKTPENPPDLSAEGYGKVGNVDMMYNSHSGSFFSHGMVVDPAPTLARFRAPDNYSSAIVKLNLKTTDPSGPQDIGYSHNLFDVIKSGDTDGFRDGDRFRACLNIRDKNRELNNYGGDRINVADMFRENGTQVTLERRGELTSWITTNIHHTRKVSGTGADPNFSMLGIVRKAQGGAGDMLDGAHAGLYREPNEGNFNYRWVINLGLTALSGSDDVRAFVKGVPQTQGMYFGPSIAQPDPTIGANVDYFLKLDNAVETVPPLRFTHIESSGTIRVGGNNRHHKTMVMGQMVVQWNSTAANFTTGANYLPLVKHQFPHPNNYGLSTRDLFVIHTIDDHLATKRPRWEVNHGTTPNVASLSSFILLRETQHTATSSFLKRPSGTNAPDFVAQAGGARLQVTGDDNIGAFVYTHQNTGFAFGDWGSVNLGNLLRVRTNSKWRSLVAGLSSSQVGGKVTIEYQDSNNDTIGKVDFDIATAIDWPGDSRHLYVLQKFVKSPAALLNKNKLTWRPDTGGLVSGGLPAWNILGIAATGGATGGENTGVFATTGRQKFVFSEYPGDVSDKVKLTIARVSENVGHIVNTVNTLIMDVRQQQNRFAEVLAIIFGVEPENATGDSIKLGRSLNLLADTARTGLASSQTSAFHIRTGADDSATIATPRDKEKLFIIRKKNRGGHGTEDSGLILEAEGKVKLDTGNTGQSLFLASGSLESSRYETRMSLSDTTAKNNRWTSQFFVDKTTGTYGLLFADDIVPSGYDKNGIDHPIVFSLRCAPIQSGLRIWWRDVDNKDIGDMVCVVDGGGNGQIEVCCTEPFPPDNLSFANGSSNKRRLHDVDNSELLLIPELFGSYELDSNNAVASTPTVTKTFESITNVNILQAGGGTPVFVDILSDEFQGTVATAPVAGPAEFFDPSEPTSSQQTTQLSNGLILLKGSVPLDTTLEVSSIISNVANRSVPRLGIAAIQWATRFGAGGGLPNAPLGLVTGQADAPLTDPRAASFDNTKFVRSVLRLGFRTPMIATDAVGRWYIDGGSYDMPSAFDSNGLLCINTDASARIARSGISGATIGMFFDLFGIEMLNNRIVSRRAFGVVADITRITGAGGGETTLPVIINNYGIHVAVQGDDGEYPDAYRYDENNLGVDIVFGGQFGKVRRQLNRSDGAVATGNSGLWIGGTNFVTEGDSVEEAIVKLDSQISTISNDKGHFEVAYSDSSGSITVTHNLGRMPQVTIIDDTDEEIFLTVTHTSVNVVTVTWNADGTTIAGTVICDTSFAGKTISVVTKTSNSTLVTTNDIINVNATSGAVTITLPTAVGNVGQQFNIKKIDLSSNSVTISGAQTIDGQSTIVITGQNDSVTIYSDNTEWWIK